MPAPPWSTGVERKVGIHVKRPQYAKRTVVVMRDAIRLFKSSGGRKA
jgi:hypothetical protein